MLDIVLPNNNEEAFIHMAEKLGYGELVLWKSRRIGELQATTKVKLYSGNEIRLYRSTQDDRKAFENTKPDIIYDLEYSGKMDSLHQKNSGLNQVLCELAKKNSIIVAISFSSLLRSQNRAIILGRIRQNIKLCRKYKIDCAIASFAQSPLEMRHPKDIAALLSVLGMGDSEVKGAMTIISSRIKRNMSKRSPEYVAEGVEKAE